MGQGGEGRGRGRGRGWGGADGSDHRSCSRKSDGDCVQRHHLNSPLPTSCASTHDSFHFTHCMRLYNYPCCFLIIRETCTKLAQDFIYKHAIIHKLILVLNR